MDFDLTDEQQLIRSEIRDLCDEFGDDYWRERDLNHEYPESFFETFAEHGWCGLTIPEAYGGQGYGVQEAALVQQEIARSGAAMAGTSITAHHTFSSEPLVAFGDEAHKERYLPKIGGGDVQVCTGVTEPNAGTDTSRIETTAERDDEVGVYSVSGQKIWTSKAQKADVIMLLARTKPREEADRFGGLTLFFTDFHRDLPGVGVTEIPKAGRGASDSNEVWFDEYEIPIEDRIAEEGKGFRYLLRFANTERIALAANAVGIGQAALEKAAAYADDRVVFGNEIGSYQGIQHPLADSWSKLEQDELMVRKAAWLYDNDRDCGAEANAVKLRASEDALEACERAVRVHGGMGYASEYDVERYWRETMINVIAPISNEMVKNYIAEHVLGLPKSY
ncbi:acyl-CoA dehydrogenase domain-containing protein [Natrialba hulunbeirensis JCM 10989]|uniref:Acyl-CoA dehydrogenase domain-containing protein n=1 Tax=Natrialba hulunbeirensis JCM 10989 TaxID=1227493 RepID=L9ZPW7_9EURY|nr:acyl-CoA dehydrogenase family protein [Natrialba hulunbeirensis]ELY87597.1 acyl-CoA dehydrogenase domain-containing protein [Natrialba hulunbeirensis JCM 10989]